MAGRLRAWVDRDRSRILLFGLLLVGGASLGVTLWWFKDHGPALYAAAYPRLRELAMALVRGAVFLVAPLSISRRTRRAAGSILMGASTALAVLVWVWACLVCYAHGGAMAVAIAAALGAGVGVIPVGMWVSAAAGRWGELGASTSACVLAVGGYVLGLRLKRTSPGPLERSP